MKRVCLKLCLALCLALCLSQSGFGQGFYDPDSIRTIELVFAESNWDQILDSLYAEGEEERLVATAIIDGVQYDSVGVRYKGNSTYQPNRIKNPFNIKLDYIIDNQEIDGYGTLKLANCWSDPSFVREVLGYEIARKYMPAAQANYANVYVNGSLLGVYTSVQDVDKLFLRTYFTSDENAFFKGEFDGPPALYTIWDYLGTDSSEYADFFELKSDSGWLDLIGFLDTLNNHPGDVAEVLDVDRHLWMLAYDWLLVNLDAPVNLPHNYYLYKDGTGRFSPVIWDLNMCFGGFSHLLVNGHHLSTTEMQRLNPFQNSESSYYPLIENILSNASYRKMYVAHMKTMMAENVENGWYYSRGQQLQTVVDSSVLNDPYKFYSYASFRLNLTSSVSGGMVDVAGITQLMDARVAYLNNRADFQYDAPVISEVAHVPSEAPANSSVIVTATATDVDDVLLAYRDEVSAAFQKVTMYDDGAHDDGSAGDGVYGATISAQTTDIDFYIYAENTNAAAFLPARAEFEYFTIPVQAGDLVINEFLADNETIQADQDSEYDDWIELYNNGDMPIPLIGHHLTDDASDLTQWTFPDTSIAAHGYLIVWADDDEEQTGLHANFKLSASGESIVLSDASVEIVDQVTFGEQTADISTGRLPNGTGEFVTMTPTFSTSNDQIGCCVGLRGNVDMDSMDVVSLGDLTVMIDRLFVSFADLECWEEANLDASQPEGPASVSLGDLTVLIDILFVTFADPLPCP